MTEIVLGIVGVIGAIVGIVGYVIRSKKPKTDSENAADHIRRSHSDTDAFEAAIRDGEDSRASDLARDALDDLDGILRLRGKKSKPPTGRSNP